MNAVFRKVASVCAGALMLLGVTGAQAATVTFSDFSSTGVFGAATQVGDSLDIDVSGFVADSSSPFTSVVFDALSFTVTAAPGRVIKTIAYSELVQGTTGVGGFAGATGNIVIGGTAYSLGFTFAPPGASISANLAISPIDVGGVGSITVQIFNSLFAAGGPATIEKTSALFEVTTVPVPAAVWMFGSAMIGLVAIARRKQTRAA